MQLAEPACTGATTTLMKAILEFWDRTGCSKVAGSGLKYFARVSFVPQQCQQRFVDVRVRGAKHVLSRNPLEECGQSQAE